ncbi:MAG: NUDIX hydrolase [Bacteroidetes bacterium]|nr:NUDIX hydrolase [Bacteroidota bacterium]
MLNFMPFTYEYPRPAVTVDIMIFSKEKRGTEILLIQRKHDPFKDCWALPGGFVDMDETLMESALRELQEETSITGIGLQQFKTYGDPGRDPRGRTVSVIFYGFAEKSKIFTRAADDAKHLEWFPVHKLPPLAFDHDKIIREAIESRVSS